MIKSHVPKGPLKDFVNAILYLEDTGTGLALQRVYQNIIINVGHSFATSDPYTNAAPVESKSTIWINGKHEKPFYLHNTGKSAFYVVAVKPGLLKHFISIPVADTNDKRCQPMYGESNPFTCCANCCSAIKISTPTCVPSKTIL